MFLTLGPFIGAITEFGHEEAAKQRYPAYEEWGLVTIGRYFEHVDFLSIYQWLSGTFIRIGFLLFIVIDLLNMNGKRKKIWMWIAPGFMLISLSLYFISDSTFEKIRRKLSFANHLHCLFYHFSVFGNCCLRVVESHLERR